MCKKKKIDWCWSPICFKILEKESIYNASTIAFTMLWSIYV